MARSEPAARRPSEGSEADHGSGDDVPKGMRADTLRPALRAALLVVLALAAPPLLYAAAAVVGAVLPRNPDWQEPERGVLIFVRTNGLHSDLVLPAERAGVDWYALTPPEHVPSPSAARGWIAFGWGQREFYLETRTWDDLRLGTALRAVLGGEAVLHVEHVAPPRPSASHRPLRIEPSGYRRMAAAIAATIERDDEGRAVPLLGRGYGEHDVFYEALGVYHAFRTSNQWTADMLAEGGVEIGIWTPFEQSVMWRFEP